MRGLLWIWVAGLALAGAAVGLADEPKSMAVDSDQDGLSDVLEQRLLVQFAPRFLIGKDDCAGVPAEFRTGLAAPLVRAQNGTIYGQVTLLRHEAGELPAVEIHYFHLWGRDCGPHGHALDSEHVSVLVRGSSDDLDQAKWKAAYWYAAAHENTVCDVSQIARAATVGAEEHGAEVWISPGKHASYLSAAMCHAGCGADKCEVMTPLKTAALINLGEPGREMNGIAFVASPQWPLLGKMKASNFPAEALVRVARLPDSEIGWANAGRHPAQGVIADSSAVEGALAGSGADTAAALSTANDATGKALSGAGESTGNALGKSVRNTKRALGKSARGVGRALGIKPGKPADSPE